MTWLDHAETIWGDRWVAPMARTMQVNPRTVQRWKDSFYTGETGETRNACPERVRQALHNAALELQRARERA